MSRSKARLAAEWFAKLRTNTSTQVVEHQDVAESTPTIDASTILTDLVGVDGSGSGLDADTLDGQHASAFALASHTHSYVSLITSVDNQIARFNGLGGAIQGSNVSIDDVGNLTATGNVTAYSDERLKSNIKTIEGGLDKVCAMRGVTFEKDGKAGLGVVAQEVQKVLPEAVQQNEEYLSVAYGNLVGVLIEAIKEQQAQIDELKAKLEV